MRHFTQWTLLLLATLTLVTGLGSCSPEQLVDELTAVELADPADPDNPMDYAGVTHNRILKEVEAHFDAVFDPAAPPEACHRPAWDIAVNYLAGDPYFDVDEVQALQYKPLEDTLHLDVMIDTLFESAVLRQRMHDFVVGLSEVELTSNLEANLLMEVAHEEVRRVLADTSLSDRDRERMLMGMSVFRHSLAFWTAALDDPESKWSVYANEVGDNKTAKGGWWKKPFAALADFFVTMSSNGGFSDAVANGAAASIGVYDVLDKFTKPDHEASSIRPPMYLGSLVIRP